VGPKETRHPSQFPLRLAKSLREAANSAAKEQGVSLNHFIAIAVAEKVSRTESQPESSPDGRQAKEVY
jgi:predicted HicB family RNase H-like nuclease